MSVETQLKAYADAVDARLEVLLPSSERPPTELSGAMRYSCLSPGKRMRPALCIAACQAVGGSRLDALDFACAIEMIHSFSLIHDDLPAIDNDDLRRGQPTCHIKFGEAIAILAGDALFALAFETASEASDSLPADRRLTCLHYLARSTGMDGLVAGETADILSEGKPVSLELLEFIHHHKTGALIRASCQIGAVAGGGSQEQIAKLGEYGSAVGLAFQIADDVLDETSTKEQLGKTAGIDKTKDKATYPRLMGVERSREMAGALVKSAIECLDSLPGPTEFLADLARFAVFRSS